MLASRRPTTHPRGLNVFAAYAQTRRPNPPFAGSTMTRLTWLASHRIHLPARALTCSWAEVSMRVEE